MLLDSKLDKGKGRFFKIRNWLNVIFILAAVAGMAICYFGSSTIGYIVIIAAIVLKFVECILRLIH